MLDALVVDLLDNVFDDVVEVAVHAEGAVQVSDLVDLNADADASAELDVFDASLVKL